MNYEQIKEQINSKHRKGFTDLSKMIDAEIEVSAVRFDTVKTKYGERERCILNEKYSTLSQTFIADMKELLDLLDLIGDEFTPITILIESWKYQGKNFFSFTIK